MTTPHLADEALSAHLDGESGEEAAEHLRSCRHCEERLARLLLVSSCVGSAVPGPPDGVREAALQVARASWAAARRESEDTGDGKGAEIVVLEERRVPRWALPAAAAAAALLLAVPVLSSLGEDRDGQQTAASDNRETAADRDAGTVVTDGGDLGEQSDPATLARAISGALPGAASEAALAAPAAPAGSSGAPSEGGSAVSPSAGVAQAPSPMAVTDNKTSAKRLGERPCAGLVRSSYGRGLGPLVYTALVRWQGIPAVVLAYRLADPGAPGLDYRVMVMALEDCRLLVAPSL